MVERCFDLLGDPIPQGHGEPGRTGHIATSENVKKVRALLVAGMQKGQIAGELGISLPTLNKHYFGSGKISYAAARAKAIAEMRAKAVMLLDREAAKGSVSAIKAIAAAAERAALEMLDSAAARKPVAAERPKAPRPAGKKEADRHAALEAEADLARRYGRRDLLN